MFERTAKLEKTFRRHARAPLFARLAEHCLHKGRLTRAQVLCEEGCERFPDYPTGHVILGRVYEHQGLWEDARAAFDQGLRLDPDQPAVYRRLSRVYRELGNPTLALKCLESAARLDPLSVSVSHQLEELAVTTRARMATTGPEPTQDEGIFDPEAGPGTKAETEREAETGRESATAVEARTASPHPASQSPPAQRPSPGDEVEPSPTEAGPMAAIGPFDCVRPLPAWEEAGGTAGDETSPAPRADGAPPAQVPGAEPVDACQGQAATWGATEFDLQPGPPRDADVPPAAPPAPEEPVPTASGADAQIDSSEVAALGEGLFDESAEKESAEEAVDLPGPASSPRDPAIETLPPAAPAQRTPSPPPVAAAAEEPPVPPAAAPATDGAPPAAEDLPPPPAAMAGFARRADDSLRAMVAEIQGPDPPGTGGAKGDDPLPFATMTLARLYAAQGCRDQAAAIYRRILDSDPNHAEAQAGLQSLSATDRSERPSPVS